MEGCSLHSPTLTTVPSSVSRIGFADKPFLHGQVLNFPNAKKYPSTRKFNFLNIKAQVSGTVTFSSEELEATSKGATSKNENVAFVAGATGRVGSRTVRELLKLGFRVRAGVRSAQKAEALVQSVKRLKLDDKNASGGVEPVEKLEIVECDLEKPNEIGPALGNASVVLCCIGASEKEVFDITGPYRIDYLATKNLIKAATIAKVNHFILLTSLGTNKVGFPAAILNLFWGVLIWKRKAEEALIDSGLPYTIVRPGGMERPTDAYKETHNITLSQEDTLFGGQVSNLQVAELMAVMAKNPGLSYYKVVEVIAETTAPLTPVEELLTKIPFQRADIYPPEELKAPGGPELAPSKPEEPSPSVEKEPVKPEPIAAQPLSPYTAYDDLKPPTSPSPTAPSSQDNLTIVDAIPKPPSDAESKTAGTPTGITEIASASKEVPVTTPLSPYVAYEDLKPPSSPSPAPSVPKEIPVNVTTTADVVPPSGGNDVAKVNLDDVPETVSPQSSVFYHSPYYVYDDFKPPTSPSPSAPSPSSFSPSADDDGGSPLGNLSVNSTAQLSTGDNPEEKQYHSKPKPRPLSPFTMYEDLKPPASPSPSLK
ncbi:protein TIC 62, chloroplastic [Ziziphus jujuba]|uniref:Protein TIC 62, chloroplastic n=1 Tax=Ziziphus jujuba TaxID=326968 RepID=A0A6P6FNE9_ZIZJJ|nr:protein TIC 62, chloroplastic [Ziziphus jujuba]